MLASGLWAVAIHSSGWFEPVKYNFTLLEVAINIPQDQGVEESAMSEWYCQPASQEVDERNVHMAWMSGVHCNVAVDKDSVGANEWDS